jgi:2-haloalkanoic acid dehalogenase type II
MFSPPSLLTFDIYGTVVDWRTGLARALAKEGIRMDAVMFDRIIDWQGKAEQADPRRRYADIVAQSVMECAGVGAPAAANVAHTVGDWPPFPDSADALRDLMRSAPCVAMTNSDRAHGPRIQANLGCFLSHWICAEEAGHYKPSVDFWHFVAERLGMPFGHSWWHVSAYADYDLETAHSLGLTCVLVERDHHRGGRADLVVPTIRALVEHVEGASE